MFKFQQILGGLGLLAISAMASAEDSRQECEAMYPADSYSAEERSQYIQECLASLGESVAEEDEGYYEGTVEDFVQSLPEEPSE